MQLLDPIFAESATLQANGIQPIRMRSALGRGLRKRQHVPCHGSASADNGMRPNAYKMVYRTKRADVGPVFDNDMSSQRRGVSHDDVAADLAIVRDVSVGHDQVVVPDPGEAAALHRAAINRDELANLVVIADLEARRLARVRNVLRRQANRREREESIIDADLRRSFQGDVRHQMAALAQFDPHANYAVGPDLAGWVNLGFGINDGRGVNGHSAKSTFLPEALDWRRPWHAAPTGRSGLRPQCATGLRARRGGGNALARCR